MFGRDKNMGVSMKDHAELVAAHNSFANEVEQQTALVTKNTSDIEALQLTINDVLRRIDTMYKGDERLRKGVIELIKKVIEQEECIKELKSRQAKDDTFYLALAELGENIRLLQEFVHYPPTPLQHVPQKMISDNHRSRTEAESGEHQTDRQTADRQTDRQLDSFILELKIQMPELSLRRIVEILKERKGIEIGKDKVAGIINQLKQEGALPR